MPAFALKNIMRLYRETSIKLSKILLSLRLKPQKVQIGPDDLYKTDFESFYTFLKYRPSKFVNIPAYRSYRRRISKFIGQLINL